MFKAIFVFGERLDEEISEGSPNFDFKNRNICFNSPENTGSLFGIVVKMADSGPIQTYLNPGFRDHSFCDLGLNLPKCTKL